MARASSLLPMLAAAALLGACQTASVPMNTQLTGEPAGPSYRLDDLNRESGATDIIIMVSMSGGGKRSAAFAHGALMAMRDLRFRGAAGESSLLDEVDQISAVSGGTFPAAHYGLYGERSFDTFRADFLDRDIEAYIYGTFLMPWNWEWMFNPLYGTNDRMATVYDRLMFHGATFGDLARRGRPQIGIVATDISYGLPFAFLPQSFDLICSDLHGFPIARAVAASNGFPVLFSPVTLRNNRAGCPVPEPEVPRPHHGPADLRAQVLEAAQARYRDPETTRWVHLMDGGISDNLAMRSMLNAMLLLRRDAAHNASRLTAIRRILMISVDGQAAADPSWPQQRVVTSLGQILSAVSGTQIDNYNVETLLLARSEIEQLAREIAVLRCRQAPRIDGQACDDVHGGVVHIALSNYPDVAERQRLQAIRTGLTIPAEDVTTLLRAGAAMVRNSPELRRELEAMAPRPEAVARAARRRVSVQGP